MKNKRLIFKIIIAVPILLFLFILLIIGSSYFEHKKLIKLEKDKYPAPGKLVEVNKNGDKLHVYSEGEGSPTLIFMSGFGTPSPMYDFKVLFEKLSSDYKICVVERAGYGWSDITKSSRDIDNVLKETRTALELAGEKPPYILVPHSLAGLEAIHWANLYPKEVQAVIGLDPLVPEYELKKESKPSTSNIIDFLMKSGLVRHEPSVFNKNFKAAKKDLLNTKDKKIARTIFYRRVQTKNMKEELKVIDENVKTVLENTENKVPFHVFISNQNEDELWKKSLISYTNSTGGKHFVLDGDHYIHLDFPDFISNNIKNIIENLGEYKNEKN